MRIIHTNLNESLFLEKIIQAYLPDLPVPSGYDITRAAEVWLDDLFHNGDPPELLTNIFFENVPGDRTLVSVDVKPIFRRKYCLVQDDMTTQVEFPLFILEYL